MTMSQAAVSSEVPHRIDRGIHTSRLTLERRFTLDSSSVHPLRCGSRVSVHCRRDAGSDRFDGSHQFRVWQRRRVHLKREPGDPAQRFTVSKDLLGDLFRITNQQRADRPRWASNPRGSRAASHEPCRRQ